MSKLTSVQQAFLAHHGIPLSRVLDATGMSFKERKRVTKELGMLVAYGVPPCLAAGHRLRTRSGHCVQCGTHNIAFLRRFEDIGDVYVALSSSSGLVKVGTAGDAHERIETLNSYGYGGIYDWRLFYSEYCPKAGRIEFIAHQQLAVYWEEKTYLRQGIFVDCQELFRCDPDIAVVAIKDAIEVEMNWS